MESSETGFSEQSSTSDTILREQNFGRLRQRKRRSQETSEHKQKQLKTQREKRKCHENTEQKQSRLGTPSKKNSKKSNNAGAKSSKPKGDETILSNKKKKTTPKQKEQTNARQIKRRINETPEQKNKRLQQNRSNMKEKRRISKQNRKSVPNNKPKTTKRMNKKRQQVDETSKAEKMRSKNDRKSASKRKPESAEQKQKRLQRNRENLKKRRNDLKNSRNDAPATENLPIQKKVSKSAQRKPKTYNTARNALLKPTEISIGAMNSLCANCGARHFVKEQTTRKTYSSCCESGKIKLQEYPPYPNPFLKWLKAEDSEGQHFRQHIRKYNNAFAFASFGYQSVHFKSGLQTFAIHGQAYHLTAKSLDKSEEEPTYSQLYFLDPEYANEFRFQNSHNKGCRKNMFDEKELFLRSNNRYADAYQMMKEVTSRSDPSHVYMVFVKDPTYDKRRYNVPVEKNEVAAVFTADEESTAFARDICVRLKGNNGLQQIRVTDPACDPMTYPVLFPYRDFGWHIGIPRATTGKRETVSQLEYYSYRLQERNSFNVLLHAGKLTQQYIVDSYLKVEESRLSWCRNNQATLRVESYLGLMDFVNSQAEQQNLKPGRVVILPSSFTGSKRAMQQSYQDAMTMVAVFGKPDLFITFTCNHRWQEIRDNLETYETAVDRPDIVATVFHLKLKEFMNDMVKNQVLGAVKAFQYVIEFQKRGLPHCHMLFILENEDKPREPEDVDKIVCAEIPDKIEDPLLYEVISTSMIHGPCGALNLSSPCMEEKEGYLQCTKKFPKPFCENTIVNQDGYPQYRRRNNDACVAKGKHLLDNGWVVPYNPYLSRKYNAHINVEICSSVKSVKYIYKYIYKGGDAALIQINEQGGANSYNWDEIRIYLDTRYLSPPEAMWRIREYVMQSRSHSIVRLAVHLPSQQNVVFSADSTDAEELRSALDRAHRKGTTLTAWFDLNRNNPAARQYRYNEIPYHFVYDKEQGTWNTRKQGGNTTLPRLYSVNPNDIERFAFRLLLLHTKGAQSYEDVRTIDGVLYNTFVGAAKALNLLEDDKQWEQTLNEAVIFQMPSQLRQLFAMILELGKPTDPKTLYATYKEHLYEDFLIHNDQQVAENKCLLELEAFLTQFGKNCMFFGLPSPKEMESMADGHFDIEEEIQESVRLTEMLNEDQLLAYNTIMNAVEGRTPNKCFFLSGAGGCGKTFLYKTLISTLLSRRMPVKAVAPTGLAATLLRNGQTIHSGFGIPINTTKQSRTAIREGTKQWKSLRETKLIIWDEISMTTSDLFTSVDESLRTILHCNEPFGGITIVVGGDFRQQAPVVKHGNRLKVIESSVIRNRIWPKFKELPLKQNMRVCADEIDFIQWLLAIGSGTNGLGERTDYVQLTDDVLSINIIESVFGGNVNSLSREELAERAILCPKNEDTFRINEQVLSMLDGDNVTLFSIDTISDCENEDERTQYPIEFLNSLTPMGMPQHKLNLKKGCIVMLLRNLNPRLGLCNGTRLIVEKVGSNVLDCSVFSGNTRGTRVFVPRLTLNTDDTDIPFKLRRKQFPVRLAYSMTITKSQGQTFDKIGVYLPQPVFTHGQLYTALSRVRSKLGVSVQLKPGKSQGNVFENDQNTYTYNCVYPELLSLSC